jgi:hypothetical protein
MGFRPGRSRDRGGVVTADANLKPRKGNIMSDDITMQPLLKWTPRTDDSVWKAVFGHDQYDGGYEYFLHVRQEDSGGYSYTVWRVYPSHKSLTAEIVDVSSIAGMDKSAEESAARGKEAAERRLAHQLYELNLRADERAYERAFALEQAKEQLCGDLQHLCSQMRAALGRVVTEKARSHLRAALEEVELQVAAAASAPHE